jgi:predicted nucleic acid-binding protein
MYLIDTDVLSLLRRQKRAPEVAAWFAVRPLHAMFLSVVTLAEIETGIEMAARKTPGFAADLRDWVRRIQEVDFADRILPVDAEVAVVWGQMAARIGNTENDLLIAATAQVHGLTVITRNTRHFAPTGVPVINPLGLG